MAKDKVQNAREVLGSLTQKSSEEITVLVKTELGDALSQYVMDYAKLLMGKCADRPAEAGSTLMLLGYLIRASEGDTLPVNILSHTKFTA